MISGKSRHITRAIVFRSSSATGCVVMMFPLPQARLSQTPILKFGTRFRSGNRAGAVHHIISGLTRGKRLVSGDARSGRRAADQPHRAGQSHARTVRIGCERLAEGGDGGRDDLCWLVAPPTVSGAAL